PVSSCVGEQPELPSFPTRRSSDLYGISALLWERGKRTDCSAWGVGKEGNGKIFESGAHTFNKETPNGKHFICHSSRKTADKARRSEEHTSELQSRFDIVCRLLLEK